MIHLGRGALDGNAQQAPNAADDRATEFQAVDGGEHYSGEKLLVGAYAAIWVILMGWLLMLWRKQASLTARLDGLEGAIDRAEARLSTKKADDKEPKRSAEKAKEKSA